MLPSNGVAVRRHESIGRRKRSADPVLTVRRRIDYARADGEQQGSQCGIGAPSKPAAPATSRCCSRTLIETSPLVRLRDDDARRGATQWVHFRARRPGEHESNTHGVSFDGKCA